MDGKGSFDQNTETYNDIIIIFTHVVPKEFEVDYANNNVTTEMDISLEELLCGFKKSIHIYDEHIDIQSDCYFDPSKPKRIPNKGFPQFKKKDSGGDLFVKFNIKYPSHEKALRKHHGDFVSIFKQK
jgi:DnaJ-class molecular chaperone